MPQLNVFDALPDIVQFDVIKYKSSNRRSKKIGSEGSVYYIIYANMNYVYYRLYLDVEESTEFVSISKSRFFLKESGTFSTTPVQLFLNLLYNCKVINWQS